MKIEKEKLDYEFLIKRFLFPTGNNTALKYFHKPFVKT